MWTRVSSIPSFQTAHCVGGSFQLRMIESAVDSDMAAARKKILHLRVIAGFILDFHFDRLLDNLLTSLDAFIHAGCDARNTRRRVYTEWVRDKPRRFSSVSTGS